MLTITVGAGAQTKATPSPDASPRVYKDPENPRLEGRLTPQPSFTQGNEECRVIEDHLADGSQTDDALIKYCRQPPDGEWKAKR